MTRDFKKIVCHHCLIFASRKFNLLSQYVFLCQKAVIDLKEYAVKINLLILMLVNSVFTSSFAVAQQSDNTTRLAKIALMRCAEIQETRKMDAAIRVRIVNDFRLDADLDPFLSGDDYLVEVVGYGLCPELLLQATDFDAKFARAKEVQQMIEASRKERAEEQAEQDKVRKGQSIYDRLARTFSYCDLEYRDYDIKFEGSRLRLWGKMFQGSRRANCSLDVEGEGVAFHVYLEGEERPFEYRPARFSTSRAPFGEASFDNGTRSLSKKDKKSISKIELVVDGLPQSECSAMRYDSSSCPIWPDGSSLTKRVHTGKNNK